MRGLNILIKNRVILELTLFMKLIWIQCIIDFPSKDFVGKN